MCGIAGIFKRDINQTIIENMLHTMRQRGPDEEGVFMQDDICLMHRRLSVIDLDKGKQPMQFSWGGETYTIVYNGELYNTEEIRCELIHLGHQFTGHSDTEVLLHAYAQWSSNCLPKFNGIFAFAIFEQCTRKLFLARDRMGVKPLFYTINDQGIIFASEIKTLLKHPGISPQLDKNGIAELLLLGPGRTPGCGVFKNIFDLKPGRYAVFDHNLHIKRYWRLLDREHTDDFNQTVEYVRFLVKDSIQRQMVSDVPLGTFLSGGLDSSIISSVCAEKYRGNNIQLPTFSVGYQNNDKYFKPEKFQPNSDDEYIKIMADYLNTKQHNVTLNAQCLHDRLIDVVTARDLPGMADVDASLLSFCGEIRKHVTVALSGECADEMFGGYPWYRDPTVRATEGFPWSQNAEYRGSFLREGILGQDMLKNYVWDRYNSSISDCDILPKTKGVDRRMKEMTNLNIGWFMQTLLDRKDRMSMYSSLEVRVPFCDHRLAEYLYSVPWEYKDYHGQEKGLLRYAMRDYLPDAVLNRKKSPYPKTYDPKYMELVSRSLRQIIMNSDEPIHRLIRKDKLEELLNANSMWPWYGQLMKTPQTIAYMIQINMWLKHYNVDILI